jgi:L-ascorbate metabolism protein UlaG (beta-lactamase superfamily)
MMSSSAVQLTYIGGPTALIEWRGIRLLTDPTFDPAGSSYPTSAYTLQKTMGPALLPQEIGPVDVVLLSHDHHFDNLDRSGRAMLDETRVVLTTEAGAQRLDSNAIGVAPWARHELRSPGGSVLRVTATPARHGPAAGDRGPAIGFVLAFDDIEGALYVSGDTVWYEGVRAVSERFDVRIAMLFCGAARVQAAGDHDLTFSADGAVEAARAFGSATIVPVHYEGWKHFTQSRADIDRAFAQANLAERLRWPAAGVRTTIEV